MNPPDIVYDGISDPKRTMAEICVKDNGNILVMNLDASHEFKSLSKDREAFNCEGIKILPQ